MKKFIDVIEVYAMVICIEVLCQIIFPISWLIFIPYRFIVWIFNIKKWQLTTEEIEETLNDMKEYKCMHYTLSYLIFKGKLNIGGIF